MAVVLVVTSAPPLVEGGHLVIARALERALTEAGHRAAVVTTPSNSFGRQASAYLANFMTDVRETGSGERVDQVISLRFPSYAVRHRHHVSWLNHTMREYYDLWDTFSSGLSPQGRVKERVRRTLIHAADTYFLRQHVTKLYAQSEIVRERLHRWNHVTSEVLHPPAPQRDYRCDGYGDYLFFASRLTPLKRADLVLEAMATPAAAGVRCVFGGEGEELSRLQQRARTLGVDVRARFIGRMNEHELIDHFARCRAVVFVPKSEDYGFVTAEAFSSGKAVVTATDSGGPLDLVRAGENGLIVSPDPVALGQAMARLMDSSNEAERMGAQARRDAAAMTWTNAVSRLVTT